MINYFAIPGIKGSIKEWENFKHVDMETFQIISKVCDYLKADLTNLLSKTRKRNVVYVRHICFFVLKNSTQMTLDKIGEVFNRDHTSIMHGIRAVQGQLSLKHHTQTKTDIDYIKFLL